MAACRKATNRRFHAARTAVFTIALALGVGFRRVKTRARLHCGTPSTDDLDFPHLSSDPVRQAKTNALYASKVAEKEYAKIERKVERRKSLARRERQASRRAARSARALADLNGTRDPNGYEGNLGYWKFEDASASSSSDEYRRGGSEKSLPPSKSKKKIPRELAAQFGFSSSLTERNSDSFEKAVGEVPTGPFDFDSHDEEYEDFAEKFLNSEVRNNPKFNTSIPPTPSPRFIHTPDDVPQEVEILPGVTKSKKAATDYQYFEMLDRAINDSEEVTSIGETREKMLQKYMDQRHNISQRLEDDEFWQRLKNNPDMMNTTDNPRNSKIFHAINQMKIPDAIRGEPMLDTKEGRDIERLMENFKIFNLNHQPQLSRFESKLQKGNLTQEEKNLLIKEKLTQAYQQTEHVADTNRKILEMSTKALQGKNISYSPLFPREVAKQLEEVESQQDDLRALNKALFNTNHPAFSTGNRRHRESKQSGDEEDEEGSEAEGWEEERVNDLGSRMYDGLAKVSNEELAAARALITHPDMQQLSLRTPYFLRDEKSWATWYNKTIASKFKSATDASNDARKKLRDFETPAGESRNSVGEPRKISGEFRGLERRNARRNTTEQAGDPESEFETFYDQSLQWDKTKYYEYQKTNRATFRAVKELSSFGDVHPTAKYAWTQDTTDVIVYVPVERNVIGKQIKVKLKQRLRENPKTMWLQPTLTDLVTLQREDKSLEYIINFITDPNPAKVDLKVQEDMRRIFTFENDVLVRRAEFNALNPDQNQICVPVDVTSELIDTYHEKLHNRAEKYGDFVGKRRLFERIGYHFWWDTMRSDIAAVVRECPLCAGAKFKPRRLTEPHMLTVSLTPRTTEHGELDELDELGEHDEHSEHAKNKNSTQILNIQLFSLVKPNTKSNPIIWTLDDLNSTHKVVRVLLEKDDQRLTWPSLEESVEDATLPRGLTTMFPLLIKNAKRQVVDFEAENRLDAAGIFPDFLPSFGRVFETFVTLGHRDLEAGMLVPSSLLSEAPNITFNGNANKLYTVMMVNIDDERTEKGNTYLNWLFINVPGNETKKGLKPFSATHFFKRHEFEEVEKYHPPKSHPHREQRILFVVYQQSSAFNPSPILRKAARRRIRMKVSEWVSLAQSLKSKCVLVPVSATFCRMMTKGEEERDPLSTRTFDGVHEDAQIMVGYETVPPG
ncbi:hypothetical protein AAMO2058_000662100 [Amorphochlora amoebiformis]